MPKSTEPAKINIETMIPGIASQAKVAIRLHPTPCDNVPEDVSKIGGRFVWPKAEAWPQCHDSRHEYATKPPILAPVVQLRAADFPEVEFRPGSDLFQLLWCPVTEDACDELMAPAPFAFWRSLDDIVERLDFEPPTDASDVIESYLLFQQCIPQPCAISPERVREYPVISMLPDELLDPLPEEMWDTYQQEEVGPCPATKIGGHPYWIQNDDTPTCDCGAKMDFLLQLPDWEYTNMDAYQRWIPLEDRWAVNAYHSDRTQEAMLDVLKPMRFDFNHFTKYVFVCRACESWPVKLIEQH
ncbi:DUF1963 domain-containing protein [Blastopirellula sp. JC732]|uniref:DUF1963 domain-containing protein n=1 Tax=Blastopirellula sediminis TaxID=2894196 RepID=A0A9X1SK95_9BACT|nr:DUF1963 domain-containing protein [Blastopirellula sediminis]MCC9607203.1 DUF1963 domain-containing protein [Blastopirellula sediminis]MCC9629504.1 DUF1963 domain-containing protein [Blastopirellula sediminis]